MELRGIWARTSLASCPSRQICPFTGLVSTSTSYPLDLGARPVAPVVSSIAAGAGFRSEAGWWCGSYALDLEARPVVGVQLQGTFPFQKEAPWSFTPTAGLASKFRQGSLYGTLYIAMYQIRLVHCESSYIALCTMYQLKLISGNVPMYQLYERPCSRDS